MSMLNQSGDEQVECPLCMEPLEVDDLNFFPCTCGYQICRFCWHRIRTDENGLCPACRKAYPENPADFKPLTQEEVLRLKAEKKQKDLQRKQKITESRKHLANVRVVQKNLVFVVGLPLRLSDPEVLKKHEYFGKFGKIHKVVINHSTSYAGSQGPSASAYVTYNRAEDALRAIQAVNNIFVDGRTLKASLGTTKYCSHFMKNQSCPKADCMYLHELGDPEASFTKEEMQQGKHQEYEKKLHDQLMNTYHNHINKDGSQQTSQQQQQSGSGGTSTGSVGTNSGGVSSQKDAWPSLHPNNNNKGEGGRRGHKSQNNNRKNRHPSGGESKGKSKEKHHHNSGNSSTDSSSSNSKSYHLMNSSSNSNCSQQHTSSGSSGNTGSVSVNHNYQQSQNGTVNGKENSLYPGLVPQLQRSPSQSSSTTSTPPPSSQHPLPPPSSTSSSSCSLASQSPPPNHVVGSLESDSSAPGTSPPVGLTGGSNLASRLPNRVSLFRQPEEDNQSFFSNNSLFSTRPAKSPPGLSLPSHANGTTASDWLPNGGVEPPSMPDSLPVHSSTDWQAAFGLGRGSVVGMTAPALSQAHLRSSAPGSGVNPGEEAALPGSTSPGVPSPAATDSSIPNRSQTDDDLGFDPFHETQKALAEMMEKESQLIPPLPQMQFHPYQNPGPHTHPMNIPSHMQHRPNLPPSTKLLDSFGILPPHNTLNTSQIPQPRTRMPPPGFSAPTHMNAFGLGMPRPQTNAGSKVMPFMGLGGSVVGSSPGFFSPDTIKEWPEGFRTLFPNVSVSGFGLNSNNPAPHQLPSPSVTVGGPHKGWHGHAPDWTTLDPAIVSSGSITDSRSDSPPHWMKSLESLTDAGPLYPPTLFPFNGLGRLVAGTNPSWPPASATPPPGFNPLRSQKQTEPPKIENL